MVWLQIFKKGYVSRSIHIVFITAMSPNFIFAKICLSYFAEDY